MTTEALENVIKGLMLITEGLKIMLHTTQVSEPLSSGDSPETNLEITLETLRKLLIQKAQEGKSEQIKEIIALFKAEKLSDVEPQHYQELFTMARKI